MKCVLLCVVLGALLFRSVEPGTNCPTLRSISADCYCSSREGGMTIVVCTDIRNTTHLEEATKSLKSLVIDRLVLINMFSDYPFAVNDSVNEIDPKGKPPSPPSTGMLPKKWLSEFRVRDLEIQKANLNGYFLTDDAFEGQGEFFISLVAKNANLRGHLCASCGAGYFSVSTKALRKTPNLRYVDLSGNHLDVLDGSVFPPNLKDLNRIILSGNKIIRVHDNAFALLHKLNHLDLSRNRLTVISRKIFRTPVDTALTTLDLSYNAIQTLPEDMFQSLNGLKELKLSHNLLEVLPASTWMRVPSMLERIDVRGNFLVCNCTMSWVSRRLSKNTKLIGHCIAPENVEFQDIKPALPSLLSC